VSSPDLAVAVADAGGVGTITSLGMPAAYLESVLAGMSNRTAGVLAANFLTAELDRDALALAAERVRIVDFFWVNPDPALVEVAHAGGALVSWQVGSVDEAKSAVDAGADMIAVQGIEAGGHVRGHSPLLPLLSAVLDSVSVPVLAAGGIGNGRGLAAVLAAGAAGARIGTLFIATDESGAHETYKQAVIDAGPTSTEITDAFADCPLCATVPRARVLRSCVEAVRGLETDLAGETNLGGKSVPITRGSGMPPGTAAHGRIDAMAMYAGESTPLVTTKAPAADVVDDLVVSAERLLRAAMPAQ
jgi:nitronate monooxygenase